jgi:D-proline reductase (dithiol) PrdB
MATLDELVLKYRLLLLAYPWRSVDPVPWVPLAKPLAESRLGLVTSAGFSMPGDLPFDPTIKGGDSSFREIPADADVSTLVENHKSDAFDHAGLAADRNLGLPLDRARELVARGRVGELNRRHLSFMGSITAPGRLVRDTAPAAAQLFVEDQVDVALLVPV